MGNAYFSSRTDFIISLARVIKSHATCHYFVIFQSNAKLSCYNHVCEVTIYESRVAMVKLRSNERRDSKLLPVPTITLVCLHDINSRI